MTSTETNDGTGSVTVYFKQGVNPDIAAVNVQNRVSRATPLLPARPELNYQKTEFQRFDFFAL